MDRKYENITAAKLAEMIAGRPVPFLLDVREPFELTAFGAIPGVVNIPMQDIPERLDDLPDKSAHIVVICQSGTRSADVSGFLVRKGFLNVYNLAGGTYAWLTTRGTGKL